MGPGAGRRGSSHWSHRHGETVRRSFAGGGALLSVVVLGLGIGLATPSRDAADGTAAVTAQAPKASTTTVTTTPTGTQTSGVGPRTLAVSPYAALAPSGAQVTVTGQGYDQAQDLWVAVCATDGVAPAAFIHCVGGAIPDDNQTTGWGIVSTATTSPYPGAVLAKWDPKTPGSFTMTLVLPAAIGDAVDCVANPCAVYTRSSNNDDRSEDVAVPVTFAPPPTTPTTPTTTTPPTTTSSSTPTTPTTPTTTAEPTTSTIGGGATTVSPSSMLQTSVPAGGDQVVVFTGFTPGEGVAVTLFSDPISLPSVTADSAGTVRVEFVVPATLAPGAHILQAVGAQSHRVGIAEFTVTAVPTTASSTPTTSSSPSPTTSTQTSSSETTSSESPTSATTTSSPSPTASATTAITAPAGGATSNNLLWLWITLAVVLLVGAAAGIVAMVRARNREDEDDLPPLVAVGAPVPPPPGWTGDAAATPPTEPFNPAVGPGDFGLLSGREPELLSGRGGPDATTQLIGPGGPEAPTQYIGPGAGPTVAGTAAGAGGTAAGAGIGASTGAGPGADPGPSTQGWQPDFTAQQPATPGEGAQPPATPGEGAQPPTTPGEEPPSTGGRHHRGD